MKLVRCDGRILEVWGLEAAPLLRLTAGAVPIRAHGWRIVEDEPARELVRQALREGAIKES